MPDPAARPAADPGISFRDLYAYHFDETHRWRQWFEKQPAAVLDVTVGDAPLSKARDLLLHVFIVEWAYVQALNSKGFDRWTEFKNDTLANIFVCADEAEAGLRKIVDEATPSSLEDEATISGGSMTLKGTRRKFLVHTFVHGTRHWAQLASALRAAGYKTDWQHDLVLSDAIE